MADGRLEVFRRALFGRCFFAHVVPLRSRPGVASVIWKSLVSMRRCSREHFADNRSVQSFFIYIDVTHSLLHCAKTTAKKPLHHLPRRSSVTKELAANSVIYFALLRKTKLASHSNVWRVGAKPSFHKLSEENPAEVTLQIAL